MSLWGRRKRPNPADFPERDPAATPGVYVVLNPTAKPCFVGNTRSLVDRYDAFRCSSWLRSQPKSGFAFATVAPQQTKAGLTPPENRRALPEPMGERDFWALLTEAKHADRLDVGLGSLLTMRESAEVAAFVARWHALLTDLYRWPLWAVAYVVRGGCSDDAFEAFRSWLICQGERAVDAARSDPGKWAVELGLRSDRPGEYDVDGELASYVGFRIYREATGFELDRAWPAVGSTPSGTELPEEGFYDAYPEVARVWRPKAPIPPSSSG